MSLRHHVERESTRDREKEKKRQREKDNFIFRKIDLYLVVLLWNMICNLGDPMSLRHHVERESTRDREKEKKRQREKNNFFST